MANHSLGTWYGGHLSDWRSVEKGFQRELLSPAAKGGVKKAIIKAFVSANKGFIDSLPAHEAPYMPFITGNLHDSIVGIVSDDGRVVNASYTDPVAITSSLLTGKDIFASTTYSGKRVIGNQAAFTAVKRMQGEYPRGIASTMLIAVPYAENPQVKGPHAGYMDVLIYKYAKAVDTAFYIGQALGQYKWKGGFNIPQKFVDSIIRSAGK